MRIPKALLLSKFVSSRFPRLAGFVHKPPSGLVVKSPVLGYPSVLVRESALCFAAEKPWIKGKMTTETPRPSSPVKLCALTPQMSERNEIR